MNFSFSHLKIIIRLGTPGLLFSTWNFAQFEADFLRKTIFKILNLVNN